MRISYEYNAEFFKLNEEQLGRFFDLLNGELQNYDFSFIDNQGNNRCLTQSIVFEIEGDTPAEDEEDFCFIIEEIEAKAEILYNSFV